MNWVILLIAAVFEIVWAIGIKYTDGFSKLWPTVGTVAAMIVSVYLLSIAAKTIPIGTAYAVWTGVGAAGTAILGILLFDEPRDIARVMCILIILCGVIGLKVFGAQST